MSTLGAEAASPSPPGSAGPWTRWRALAHRYGPVAILIAIGLLLHAAPYVRTPFGTDVNWVFRLQTLDPGSPTALKVPEVFSRFAAEPSDSSWHAFLQWHAFTGRYNVLDILALRFIGDVGLDSPFAWKLFALFFALGATVLFFLTLERLEVRRALALPLAAVSLFLIADDYWVEYKAAEPRAAFFMMLAVWLTSRRARAMHDVLAAIAMGAAVLTKEPFASGWVLLLAMHVVRASKAGRLRWGELFRAAAPHAVAGVACAAFIVVLRGRYVVTTGYSTFESIPSLRDHVYGMFWTFVPSRVDLIPVVVGLVVLLVANRHGFVGFRAGLTRLSGDGRIRLLLLGVLSHLAAHVAVYALAGRVAAGRYAVPLNYTLLLGLALLIQCFYREFQLRLETVGAGVVIVLLSLTNARSAVTAVWTGVLAVLFVSMLLILRRRRGSLLVLNSIFVLFLCADRFVYPRAYSFHEENRSFERLLNDLDRRSPRDAIVVFKVEDAHMNEIVQSAEANLILRDGGRSDRQFRFEPSAAAAARCAPFIAKLIHIYNDRPYDVGRRPVVNVHADRSGRTGRSDVTLPKALRALVRSPPDFVRLRYEAGRQVRGINYRFDPPLAPERS